MNAGEPMDQQAVANAEAPDTAEHAAAEPVGEMAAEQPGTDAPQTATDHAVDADAADKVTASEAPAGAGEAAGAAEPSPAGVPEHEAAAEQPAAEEQEAAAAGDAEPAAAPAAKAETVTEEAQIPDAASIYAAPPPTIGTKRSLEADGSTANTEAADDAHAAAGTAAPEAGTQAATAAAPAPSPKRQRLSPAPGSWDTILRLVVPQRRVGLIIGKQGATITELQKTTGARIQVTPAVPLCDERVVVLSAPELPSAPTNGAVSALLGIHRVITSADPEPPGVPTVVKLLVGRTQAAAVPAPEPASQGPAEASTAGATVKLLRAKHLPLTALSNDRAVEISGSADAVGTALAALAARLRAHPAKQRPGGIPPLLAERIAANAKGPLGRGGPPPPPPPRAAHGPPAAHVGRPQQYGAPAAYY